MSCEALKLRKQNHVKFVETPWTRTTVEEKYRMCPYRQLLVRMSRIRARTTRANKHNTKRGRKAWGREEGRLVSSLAKVVKSLATSLFPSFKRDFHWPRFKGILGDFILDGFASPTQLIRTLLCSPWTRSISSGSSRVADWPLLPSPLLLRCVFSAHSSSRTK